MNHRIPPHTHRKSTTPTPIRMGVKLVFATVGMGAGLAGTLPAYSRGGGGGADMGLETTGTGAAARGEAMVAAASKFVTSKTSTICSPNETTSPAFKTRGPARRWPFTNVPLVEPRSSIIYLPP